MRSSQLASHAFFVILLLSGVPLWSVAAQAPVPNQAPPAGGVPQGQQQPFPAWLGGQLMGSQSSAQSFPPQLANMGLSNGTTSSTSLWPVNQLQPRGAIVGNGGGGSGNMASQCSRNGAYCIDVRAQLCQALDTTANCPGPNYIL